MIHPSTEVRYISRLKGYGLFAKRYIPMGTLIWVRDQLDREIPPDDLLQYNRLLRETIINFSYRNSRGNYIFCWDNVRYMNHDCNFNTCITPYDLEIVVKDIHKGEEITNHYGMLNIIEPFELPNENGKVVCPDDLLSHGPKWDAMLQEAFPFLLRVEQPLRSLVPDSRWELLEQISKGHTRMQSITSCYFHGYEIV